MNKEIEKDEFNRQALKAFYDLSNKMGDDHNLYVNLEVNGVYQPVAVKDLLEEMELETRIICSELPEAQTNF